ncbi:hypothetical protein AcV7_007307 [Taiwanofungus camphoratus]|nr:hypothetical protein AcW2_005525 [Antrodia cinnamomea]KAI0953911.1 hypothetical protein AcV7_007307 [Antrodia cinnamomea]
MQYSRPLIQGNRHPACRWSKFIRIPRYSGAYIFRPFASAPHASFSLQSSVNPDEIEHFSRLSSQWWDERGEFQLLHKMNPVRMQFIRDKVIEMHREDGTDASLNESQVLEGMDVLDVGCGGGLLCESLARLGGNTLGIDASPSNIAIASLHASIDPSLSLSSSFTASPSPANAHPPYQRKGTLAYEHTSVEDLFVRRGPQQFDIVCSMEVIEHVDNPSTFLSNCAQLVKPGGHLFLSTIARTPLAYLLTILAAEHVLRLVTPGTHTYSKYINPDEVLGFFEEYQSPSSPDSSAPGKPWISHLYNGLPSRTEAETRGMIYLPWKGEWVLVPRSGSGGTKWGEACNYIFWVRRPME